MKNKTLSILVVLMIAVIVILGILVCVFWYPFSLSVWVHGILPTEHTQEMLVSYYSQLIFHWATSLPCFVILFLSFRIVAAIRKGTLFSMKIAKLLKTFSIILYADLAVFLVGTVLIVHIFSDPFAIVYLCIAALGIAIAIGLSVMADFTERAAILQEEYEGTI